MKMKKTCLSLALIIFFSLILFSYDARNVQAGPQCTAAQGYCAASCPNGALGSTYDCDSLGGEDCCRNAAAPGAGTAGATTFSNPISHNSIIDLFYGILTSLRSWIAVIAIIFIIIGGLMYMMSAGDEKMITRAKSTITSALIGLAIAVAAPTFLKELLAILGNPGGTNAQSLIDNSLTVQQIAMRVLSFLLSVVGVIGIIGLVVGGSFYLTAYGDEKRIDKGKSIITYSVIGIVVALAALLLVKQVIALLS